MNTHIFHPTFSEFAYIFHPTFSEFMHIFHLTFCQMCGKYRKYQSNMKMIRLFFAVGLKVRFVFDLFVIPKHQIERIAYFRCQCLTMVVRPIMSYRNIGLMWRGICDISSQRCQSVCHLPKRRYLCSVKKEKTVPRRLKTKTQQQQINNL